MLDCVSIVAWLTFFHHCVLCTCITLSILSFMAIWQTHFNYIKYANKITWKIMCERERYGLWCAYTYALSGIILFYCILSFWIHHEICIHTPCYSIFKKITSPEVGQSHWVHGEKGPAEAVLPSPAEEVQPATGAVDTVLLCHHWIHPLHVNSCLVQLSYQIWPQKTTEGSPDCWAKSLVHPSPLSKNCTHTEWAKGWQNHSGPLTSSTLPLWTVTVWSTLQSSEHQNDQTQKQILSPSNHLMNTWH